MTQLEVGDRVKVRRDIQTTYADEAGTVTRLIPGVGTAMVRLDAFPKVELPFTSSEVWRFLSVHRWTHDCAPCRQRLADRIAGGQCALEDGQCLTHNVPDTAEHHFHVHPDAYND